MQTRRVLQSHGCIIQIWNTHIHSYTCILYIYIYVCTKSIHDRQIKDSPNWNSQFDPYLKAIACKLWMLREGCGWPVEVGSESPSGSGEFMTGEISRLLQIILAKGFFFFPTDLILFGTFESFGAGHWLPCVAVAVTRHPASKLGTVPPGGLQRIDIPYPWKVWLCILLKYPDAPAETQTRTYNEGSTMAHLYS